MAGREYVTPSVPAANTMLSTGQGRMGSNGFGVANGAEAIQSNPNFLSASTFSNTTPTEIGLQPNKSIPYHYSCKATDESRFSPGALMFNIKNPNRYRNPKLPCPQGSRRVEDLIELNTWLAGLDDDDNAKLPEAADVLKEIKFLGVLKTKISESQRERQLGTFVLNNVVAGRASVVNVWGNAAREATPLYMIIKKVRKNNGQKWVWNFQPYASMQNIHPQSSDMLYLDKANGNQKFGELMKIGTSMSTPTAHVEGNESLIESTLADRLSMYSGGVDVCIGV
jgi:hypothetical protein